MYVVPADLGGVAQMVERLLCMQEAQGSIPCSSTFFFVVPSSVALDGPGLSVVDTRGGAYLHVYSWVAADVEEVVVGALAQW
jgi:hypothetical protein